MSGSDDGAGMAIAVGACLVGGGILTGLGYGFHALGAAIGLHGFAAFCAGGGIIIGGLAVLGVLAYGICCAVEYVWNKQAEKAKKNELVNTMDARLQLLSGKNTNEIQKTLAQTPLIKTLTATDPACPVEEKPGKVRQFWNKLFGKKTEPQMQAPASECSGQVQSQIQRRL